MFKRLIAILISCVFLIEQTGYAQVAPQMGVPQYLQGLISADKFRPMHLRSVSFEAEKDSLLVNIEQGDDKKARPAQADQAAAKLLEFFKIGLALPNSTFWVNLRPDAADQIIDPLLEKTDLGKVLLEADLQLKKDMAALTSPNTPEGRQYWNKLYARAEIIFPGQEAEIPTYNRPWIVPGEIILGVGQNNTAYVYKATLKVLLESDALVESANAGQAPLRGTAVPSDDIRVQELNEYSAQLIKQLILPKLTRQINSSRKYAPLRQAYYSLVLAQWFKQKFAGQTGVPSSFISSINSKDILRLVSDQAWSKDTYFKAYQRSFQQGEYSKEEAVSGPSGLTVRRYFSGGFKMPELFPRSATAAVLPSVTVVQMTTPMSTDMQATLLPSGQLSVSYHPAEIVPTQAANADGGRVEIEDVLDQLRQTNFDELFTQRVDFGMPGYYDRQDVQRVMDAIVNKLENLRSQGARWVEPVSVRLHFNQEEAPVVMALFRGKDGGSPQGRSGATLISAGSRAQELVADMSSRLKDINKREARISVLGKSASPEDWADREVQVGIKKVDYGVLGKDALELRALVPLASSLALQVAQVAWNLFDREEEIERLRQRDTVGAVDHANQEAVLARDQDHTKLEVLIIDLEKTIRQAGENDGGFGGDADDQRFVSAATSAILGIGLSAAGTVLLAAASWLNSFAGSIVMSAAVAGGVIAVLVGLDQLRKIARDKSVPAQDDSKDGGFVAINDFSRGFKKVLSDKQEDQFEGLFILEDALSRQKDNLDPAWAADVRGYIKVARSLDSVQPSLQGLKFLMVQLVSQDIQTRLNQDPQFRMFLKRRDLPSARFSVARYLDLRWGLKPFEVSQAVRRFQTLEAGDTLFSFTFKDLPAMTVAVAALDRSWLGQGVVNKVSVSFDGLAGRDGGSTDKFEKELSDGVKKIDQELKAKAEKAKQELKEQRLREKWLLKAVDRVRSSEKSSFSAAGQLSQFVEKHAYTQYELNRVIRQETAKFVNGYSLASHVLFGMVGGALSILTGFVSVAGLLGAEVNSLWTAVIVFCISFPIAYNSLYDLYASDRAEKRVKVLKKLSSVKDGGGAAANDERMEALIETMISLSADKQKRLDAVRQLGELGDKRAGPALTLMLLTNLFDGKMRKACASALADISEANKDGGEKPSDLKLSRAADLAYWLRAFNIKYWWGILAIAAVVGAGGSVVFASGNNLAGLIAAAVTGAVSAKIILQRLASIRKDVEQQNYRDVLVARDIFDKKDLVMQEPYDFSKPKSANQLHITAEDGWKVFRVEYHLDEKSLAQIKGDIEGIWFGLFFGGFSGTLNAQSVGINFPQLLDESVFFILTKEENGVRKTMRVIAPSINTVKLMVDALSKSMFDKAGKGTWEETAFYCLYNGKEPLNQVIDDPSINPSHVQDSLAAMLLEPDINKRPAISLSGIESKEGIVWGTSIEIDGKKYGLLPIDFLQKFGKEFAPYLGDSRAGLIADLEKKMLPEGDKDGGSAEEMSIEELKTQMKAIQSYYHLAMLGFWKGSKVPLRHSWIAHAASKLRSEAKAFTDALTVSPDDIVFLMDGRMGTVDMYEPQEHRLIFNVYGESYSGPGVKILVSDPAMIRSASFLAKDLVLERAQEYAQLGIKLMNKYKDDLKGAEKETGSNYDRWIQTYQQRHDMFGQARNRDGGSRRRGLRNSLNVQVDYLNAGTNAGVKRTGKEQTHIGSSFRKKLSYLNGPAGIIPAVLSGYLAIQLASTNPVTVVIGIVFAAAGAFVAHFESDPESDATFMLSFWALLAMTCIGAPDITLYMSTIATGVLAGLAGFFGLRSSRSVSDLVTKDGGKPAISAWLKKELYSDLEFNLFLQEIEIVSDLGEIDAESFELALRQREGSQMVFDASRLSRGTLKYEDAFAMAKSGDYVVNVYRTTALIETDRTYVLYPTDARYRQLLASGNDQQKDGGESAGRDPSYQTALLATPFLAASIFILSALCIGYPAVAGALLISGAVGAASVLQESRTNRPEYFSAAADIFVGNTIFLLLPLAASIYAYGFFFAPSSLEYFEVSAVASFFLGFIANPLGALLAGYVGLGYANSVKDKLERDGGKKNKDLKQKLSEGIKGIDSDIRREERERKEASDQEYEKQTIRSKSLLAAVDVARSQKEGISGFAQQRLQQFVNENSYSNSEIALLRAQEKIKILSEYDGESNVLYGIMALGFAACAAVGLLASIKAGAFGFSAGFSAITLLLGGLAAWLFNGYFRSKKAEDRIALLRQLNGARDGGQEAVPETFDGEVLRLLQRTALDMDEGASFELTGMGDLAIKPLLQVIEHRQVQGVVIQTAIKALGLMAKDSIEPGLRADAVKSLVALLEDSRGPFDHPFLLSAIQALGEIGDPAAVASIEKFVDDWVLGASAKEALRKIEHAGKDGGDKTEDYADRIDALKKRLLRLEQEMAIMPAKGQFDPQRRIIFLTSLTRGVYKTYGRILDVIDEIEKTAAVVDAQQLQEMIANRATVAYLGMKLLDLSKERLDMESENLSNPLSQRLIEAKLDRTRQLIAIYRTALFDCMDTAEKMSRGEKVPAGATLAETFPSVAQMIRGQIDDFQRSIDRMEEEKVLLAPEKMADYEKMIERSQKEIDKRKRMLKGSSLEASRDGGNSERKEELIGQLAVLTQEMLEKWDAGEPAWRDREVIINKFHYLLRKTGVEQDAFAITADDHVPFAPGDLIFFKDTNGDNHGVVISYAGGKLTYYRVFSHPIPVDSHLMRVESQPVESFKKLKYLALPAAREEFYAQAIKDLEAAKDQIYKDNPVIRSFAAKEEIRRINARINQLQNKMRTGRDGGSIEEKIAQMRQRLKQIEERNVLYQTLNRAARDNDPEALMTLRAGAAVLSGASDLDSLRQGDLVFFNRENSFYYFISRQGSVFEFETYPTRGRVPMSITLNGTLNMYVIPLGRDQADAQNKDGGEEAMIDEVLSLGRILDRKVNFKGRAEAIAALAVIPHKLATRMLIKSLNTDDFWSIRKDAAVALGRVSEARDEAETALLEALCHDEDWGVRQMAAESLVALDSGRAAGVLARAARDDEDWGVRKVAMRSLAAINFSDAMDIFSHAMVFDRDWGVRKEAVLLLGETESLEALPWIRSVAESDDDSGVRDTAKYVAGELSVLEQHNSGSKDGGKDFYRHAQELVDFIKTYTDQAVYDAVAIESFLRAQDMIKDIDAAVLEVARMINLDARVAAVLEHVAVVARKENPDFLDGGSKKETPAAEVGGIDLRALPLNAVPISPAQIAPAVVSSVPLTDLDKDWQQIVQEMQSGPMPYDKLKAHVQQCCGREEAAGHLQEVSACVMKILELEEDAALTTSSELKEVLCCLS